MSHYLLHNVITGETLGPYEEREVVNVLWGKGRGEWMIYKQLQGEVQAVINRICKRCKRARETEEVHPLPSKRKSKPC